MWSDEAHPGRRFPIIRERCIDQRALRQIHQVWRRNDACAILAVRRLHRFLGCSAAVRLADYTRKGLPSRTEPGPLGVTRITPGMYERAILHHNTKRATRFCPEPGRPSHRFYVIVLAVAATRPIGNRSGHQQTKVTARS